MFLSQFLLWCFVQYCMLCVVVAEESNPVLEFVTACLGMLAKLHAYIALLLDRNV